MSYEEKKKADIESGDDSERLKVNILRYMWEASPFFFKESYHTYIRHLAIFKSFTDNDIRLLTTYLHRREFETNEVIFKTGDSGYGLYFIHQGSVSVQDINGEKIVLLDQKKFFGELALLEDGHKRPVTVVVEEPTVLLGFFKPDLDNMLGKHPVLGAKFVREIAMILANKVGPMAKEILSLKRKIEVLEKKN